MNLVRWTSAFDSVRPFTTKHTFCFLEMTTPYLFVKSVVREWFRSHQLIITPAFPLLRDKVVQTLSNVSFINAPCLMPLPNGLDPNVHGPFLYARLQSLLGNQYGKNQILAVYTNITYLLWHVMNMLCVVCGTMNRKRIPPALVSEVWDHCEKLFLRQFDPLWVLPGVSPNTPVQSFTA